ncbi:MAG TPA: MBL fold metallo-hydrolase [Acidimicrobiales bacterium]|jgi:glyoxylase-like metal-dependent hydrolase (beta-lactamase superfamily II)|nr:MBL fold metallo-hydrolase [Acidimicrobiales bacterium]
MATPVPHVRDLQTVPGRVDMVSPHIRRVLADNPSPFTMLGTGTYIVGYGRVAVVDAGPRDDRHVAALLAALRGETIEALLVTHTHGDHSPATALLKASGVDAPIYGFGPHPLTREVEERIDEAEGKVEERADVDFQPDVRVSTGDVIQGPGWTFDVLHTPGHISNHLCFGYREERALFSGDHVMGWATTIIPPPDGDMVDYLASLRLLLDRDDVVYWPTHGPPVREPQTYVGALLNHRVEREAQILDLLGSGPKRIPAMVRVIYQGYPRELHKPAGRSVLAHLVKLVREGRVASSSGEARINSRYSLA